jgi:hypothetical protein
MDHALEDIEALRWVTDKVLLMNWASDILRDDASARQHVKSRFAINADAPSR